MRLLLVEDELPLCEALTEILEKNHYSVTAVNDGESGLNEALSGVYDIILLDIMLPRRSGLEILSELRKARFSVPVLLLTAKGAPSDKVQGLDCGADDYLAKPFDTDELLARLRALCRRKGDLITEDTLSFSDLTLDLASYELLCGEKRTRLSNREFEIIRHFLLHQHAVVNKEELLAKLWGSESGAESNNLEVYVSFLRKKLAFLGAHVKITALRGVGYQLIDTSPQTSC